MVRVLPLCLFLCACAVATGVPPAPPIPPEGADPCAGRQYAGLVGQPDTALERVLILRQVRVLRPGMARGALRPERLSFEIGPDSRIARISCS